MNFDIAFVGNYTKDTIITPQETRTVNGGAFLYGAYVVAKMGLKAAVVTRLAREDFEVVEDLTRLGAGVFAKPTAQSTCLRLVYPTTDLDQRSISIEGNAGAFTLAEVAPVQARVFHIGASIRGEVPPEVIEALAQKGARISLDVQGFVRINQGGKLVHANWPEQARVLKLVDVLKTDGVEAEILTGEKDIKEAAKILADFGPQEIVVTHRDGVLVYAGGRFYEAPFFPREVRGRTGRGDTCTAAYLGKRLTAPPAEATVWAAALTSLKMEQGGPFRREISEVEALIRERY
ncbi:MAG: carbohydrate kinase [Anaerolineae bacterium]|nr:carbohydrate kinase [Anaerolineae bacterium]